MKKSPTLWKLKELFEYVGNRQTLRKTVNDGWVPSRPEGFFSLGNRISLAWVVFTGQADVVIWSDQ
jgi:hypothetical protein